MICEVVHECMGCRETERRKVDAKDYDLNAPASWNKLSFNGGAISFDVCGKCTARVLEVLPVMKQSLDSLERRLRCPA